MEIEFITTSQHIAYICIMQLLKSWNAWMVQCNNAILSTKIFLLNPRCSMIVFCIYFQFWVFKSYVLYKVRLSCKTVLTTANYILLCCETMKIGNPGLSPNHKYNCNGMRTFQKTEYIKLAKYIYEQLTTQNSRSWF